MEKGILTKNKVLDAAALLFNTQGYNGTSIRAIAEKAGVNVALISYYFNNKQGLLETLMLQFFEGYLEIIEVVSQQKKEVDHCSCLIAITYELMKYQQCNLHLARFVHREVTLDNTLVRELMMTYFMKEKHYLREIVVDSFQMNDQSHSVDFFIMQLRALITMPYSQPQYIQEVFHLFPHEPYFVSKYMKVVEKWIYHMLMPLYNEKKEVCYIG